MSWPTVTVGGLPGTGTSTLCSLLRDALQVPYVYAGQIFREEAARRGLDLAAFGRLCESDSRVDRELDERQIALLRRGGIVLEGRLSGHLAASNGIPAFKIWLTCAPEERVRRLVERDGGTPADQEAATKVREASEADRYRRYYGIDLGDLSVYDLVLDSTQASPREMAQRIVAQVRKAA